MLTYRLLFTPLFLPSPIPFFSLLLSLSISYLPLPNPLNDAPLIGFAYSHFNLSIPMISLWILMFTKPFSLPFFLCFLAASHQFKGKES